MANSSKTPKKPNRVSQNAYKKGRLSRQSRFSSKNGKTVNKTFLAVVLCVLFTFIFAVILGNVLGNIAEDSKNTTTSPSDPSGITPPNASKVPPHEELNAFFADMTGAAPEKSLSEQTSGAREMGNSIFISMREADGTLIFSSPVADELGFAHRENLTLARLGNHFDYYDDFAVGLFKSDFSHKLENGERLEITSNEALLLAEAAEVAFDQMIIEFSGNITRDNAIYYCSYLIEIKLACKGTPIGISLPLSLLSDSNNAGVVADLLGIADFFVFDLSTRSADEISSAISPLVYFIERYNGVACVSGMSDPALQDRIAALLEKSVTGYIVK